MRASPSPFPLPSNKGRALTPSNTPVSPFPFLKSTSNSASRSRISPVSVVEKENCGFLGPLITPARNFMSVVSCLTVKKMVSNCKVSTFKAWIAAFPLIPQLGAVPNFTEASW